eukprot:scaffold20246_cov129-Isochrysis_galbana.AAC.2
MDCVAGQLHFDHFCATAVGGVRQAPSCARGLHVVTLLQASRVHRPKSALTARTSVPFPPAWGALGSGSGVQSSPLLPLHRSSPKAACRAS